MKKVKICNVKVRAYTLNEILVVLIIVGVLVMLAIPRLMPLISKAKSTEAKLQLNHLYTLQQGYFYEFSKYSEDLVEIGFEQEKLSTEGGQANYRIEIIDSGPSHFIARATSIVDFDKDGVFNIWEIDSEKQLKEVVKD